MAPATRPPILKRWMAYPLLIGAALAIGASAWALHYREVWSRPMPKVDVRFDVVGRKIAEPVRISPAEEYPGPNGETFYLTEDQFRAVSMTSGLSKEAALKLADALADKDPESQAAKLQAMIDDAAKSPDRDRELIGLYRINSGALKALPEGFKRDAAIESIDRVVGCRYVGPQIPPCPDRPSMATAYTLGGAASAAWLVAIGGIVAGLVARRRAKPAAPAAIAPKDAAKSEAPGDDGEAPSADATAEES